LRKFLPAGQFLDKLGPPPAFFRRLSIANKMLLGYMVLVVLTLMVAGYSLFSLQQINLLNGQIVKVEVVIQESSDKMLDSLLAMDTYEKRFLVLGTDDMASLFQKRRKEFDSLLEGLQNLPGKEVSGLHIIQEQSAAYEALFSQEVQLVHHRLAGEARAISDGQLKNILDNLMKTLRTQSANAKISQDGKMSSLGNVGRTAFLTSIALCVVSMLIGAFAAILVTHYVSSSVLRLTDATAHFAEGDFEYDPKITTGDEIGLLSRAFLAMGKRLSKLEELYLDASPLTRLPGGVAIEIVLEKRIDQGQPLAFFWIDLANFKAFNDRYGYAKGNEVIKETAVIVENTVRALGTPDDFVGHVGGDDFVVMTVPHAMQTIAEEIIAQFDRRAPEFYAPEDRKLGYIMGTTRQGVEMRFPIMTISIAVVTNERRKLTGLPEVSSIAAQLKGKIKMDSRSVFVIDRRES
jgi:GGDEF domain-containing protein/CHASE3 domain sensor protein